MTAEIVRPELENAERPSLRMARLRQVVLGLIVAASVMLVVDLGPVPLAERALGVVAVLGVGGAALAGTWLSRRDRWNRERVLRLARLAPFAGFGFIPGTQIDWAFGLLLAGVFLGVLSYAVYAMGGFHGGKGTGRGKALGALAVALTASLLLLGAYGVLTPSLPPGGPPPGTSTSAIYGIFTSSQITTDVINQGSVYTACTSLNLPWTPGASGTKAGVLWSSTGYTTASVVQQSAPGATAGAQISIANTINTAKAASASGWDTFDCFEVQISVTLASNQVPIGSSGTAIAMPLSVQLVSASYTTNIANGTTSGSPVNVFYRDTAAGNTQYAWYLLTTNTPNGGSASNSAQLCPGAQGQIPLAINPTTCPWVSAGSNTGAAASLVKVMFVTNAIGPFGYLSTANQQFQVTFQVGNVQGVTLNGVTYTVPPAVYTITEVRQ